MTKELWRLGDDYDGAPIDPASCDPDPIVEVQRWLDLAIDANLGTPNAMTLATVDERGRPAARIVLLKEIDARGFTFYTNYDSRKGHDLAAHPHAALVLFWEPMHRQIRIEGAIERVSAAQSDAYFASRPRGSQIGAIASPQSQPIVDRAALEATVAALEAQHGDHPLARPANWGRLSRGPRTRSSCGRANRPASTDRVRYRRIDGAWTRDRLAP